MSETTATEPESHPAAPAEQAREPSPVPHEPAAAPNPATSSATAPGTGRSRPVANHETFRALGGRGVQHTLWLAGISDVVLIAVGIASTYTYTWHTGHAGHTAHHISLGLGVLAGVVAAVAVINFLCFYWMIRQLTEAIAAAVVLTYFIVLACMLNTNVQQALNSTSLGGSMLTSLTTLTATVGAFYFAGTSYERAAKIKAQGQAGGSDGGAPGGGATES